VKPNGWKKTLLKDCVIGKGKYGANASAGEYSPNLPRFVRITDISDNGRLREGNKKSIPEKAAEGHILKLGDFVFARTGATVGKAYRYVPNGERQAFAGYLIKFEIDQSVLAPDYLEQFTQTQCYWAWVNATIRAGAQPNINSQEFGKLTFLLPPIEEQRQICIELDRWDRRVNLSERLIFAKQELRKGLMQQLINGKMRVPGFMNNWHMARIGDLVQPISRVVPKPNKPYKAMGIRSHFKGTFVKEVDNPEKISMNKLYIAKAGDLIVNITFAWEGAISIVPDKHDNLLVSHRFPTYVPKLEKINPSFLGYLIIQPKMLYLLRLISPGGAGRNRVMNQKDFLNLKLHVPPLDEQKSIGKILSCIDREISTLKAILAEIKMQKRGLLQQLLTGKIRVKVSDVVAN